MVRPFYDILIHQLHEIWLYRNKAFHLLLYRLSRHSHLEVIIWLISLWMGGDDVQEEREHGGVSR